MLPCQLSAYPHLSPQDGLSFLSPSCLSRACSAVISDRVVSISCSVRVLTSSVRCRAVVPSDSDRSLRFAGGGDWNSRGVTMGVNVEEERSWTYIVDVSAGRVLVIIVIGGVTVDGGT